MDALWRAWLENYLSDLNDPGTLHALVDGSQMEPNNANAFINDTCITTGVRSSMRLFADDSKAYRIIYN